LYRLKEIDASSLGVEAVRTLIFHIIVYKRSVREASQHPEKHRATNLDGPQ
jgi:hypothetical protein